MKALFIHDHPFIKNENTGTLYTSGNLNSNLWERYLKHYNTVTVIGRCKQATDTSRYHEAEKENVHFKLFEDVLGGADYFTKRSKIEKVLIEEIAKHDVIIMRFPATISIFAAKYCQKNNIPYIAEVVGCSWDANWNYGGLAPRIVAPYSYYFMKKAVKKAFASIYVTREFLQKRYPSNATIQESASNVILNEIDANAIVKRLENLQKQNFKNFNLGIIGNIAVQYKGYDVLLEAVNKLPIEIKEKIKIFFVGGGDPTYLKSLVLRNKLSSQTEIVGKLKAGKEIFDFLDKIDLYVHPSKQEGLPRVVIEAMSRACPVLASGAAGTPELIDNKYIHTPGDVSALAAHIKGVFSNKFELKEMAEVNFESSKTYLFSTLENRRETFFSTIKKKLNNN